MNQYWFKSIDEAKSIINKWREEYNNFRPHSSLNMMSPKQFTDSEARQMVEDFIEGEREN